jgi:hypothetical protein
MKSQIRRLRINIKKLLSEIIYLGKQLEDAKF